MELFREKTFEQVVDDEEENCLGRKENQEIGENRVTIKESLIKKHKTKTRSSFDRKHRP